MKRKHIIEAACCSNIGKIRKKNEDNFCFDNNIDTLKDGSVLKYNGTLQSGLYFALFDGMGGENFGEYASETAASKMLNLDIRLPRMNTIKSVVEELNKAVVLKQQEMLTDKMGTTMASIHFYQNTVFVCNVGDSRVYRFRNGALQQLSNDHTETQTDNNKKGALIQYLGMDPEEVRLEPHILKREIESGDIYLLCSDGLTDMLTDFEINYTVKVNGNSEIIAEKLISAAIENGGRDNITVIVCKIQ